MEVVAVAMTIAKMAIAAIISMRVKPSLSVTFFLLLMTY
jgi:hypothetical protein